MGYILNQYNKPKSAGTSTQDAENLVFMTPILEAEAKRKKNAPDIGVSGDSLDPFSDECVQMQEALTAGRNYYFHGKIKRLNSLQKFYIKLVNFTDNAADSTEAKEQYIKTVVIQDGDENEWVDIEFVFTPLIPFDTILFQLQREASDYKDHARIPIIVYEELNMVNNIISSQIANGVNLLKIGVQARPGLMMCINGEEVHVGRTGIYEIKNGVITVSFFSVVSAASEDESAVGGINLANFLRTLAEEKTSEEYISSTCIFNKPKTRAIESFTLDYMYKEE